MDAGRSCDWANAGSMASTASEAEIRVRMAWMLDMADSGNAAVRNNFRTEQFESRANKSVEQYLVDQLLN
jgi:hypothetical protein